MPDYPLYQEPLRPQFHFTARYWDRPTLNPDRFDEGWINDVNGLTWLDGEYHLFAQRWWTCWLHAVSEDLVRWTELPPAFGQDEAFGGTQSGGGVIDARNTSGLATGETPVMVAFWSSTDNCRQCLSYSNDRGRTWTKWAGNPVLSHPCRDPRVLWYAPQSKWVMVLYGPEEGGERYYTLFESPDLLHWTKLQSLPGFYECPDMFELPVDGDADRRLWVIVNGDGRYRLGEFDGHTFTPVSETLQADLGRNFYATMTWGDLPGQPWRRIQLAWMATGDLPPLDLPFSQQLSFPCDLSLHAEPEGVRLWRWPAPEIAQLVTGTWQRTDLRLSAGDEDPLAAVTHDALDVRLRLDLARSTCRSFRLSARGHEIIADLSARTGTVLGCPWSWSAEQSELSLRLLVDRLSVETFVDGGRRSYTNTAPPLPGAAPLSLAVADGTLAVVELTVQTLGSMWDPASAA